MVYEVGDYVILSKEEFMRIFGRYLYPERLMEFRGGYYDGSTMMLWELGGIEVGVETYEVVMRKEDYVRLKRLADEKEKQK